MTRDELKALLHYDPETGVFTYAKNIGAFRKNDCRFKGERAGTVCGGYIVIHLNSKDYSAHRLAWLYVNGYFPENDVDHINRVKHDNRLVNLREASRSCNMLNSRVRSTNTSGVTGVRTKGDKWTAYICINYKPQHLYYGPSFVDAVKARYKAEIKYECASDNSSAYKYLRENGHV